MSKVLKVCAGQKSLYKWLEHRHISYFYQNILKNLRIPSTAQYCISVKDENYNFKNIANINNIQENISQQIERQSNSGLEKRNNKLVSAQKIKKDTLIFKKIERLYPSPKSSLHNIYMIVSKELNDPTVLTSTSNENMSRWEVTYNVKWPEAASFKEVAKTKKMAAKIASMKCLYWLEMNDKLNNGKPILYRSKNLQLKPVELSVTPNILDDMKDLIKIYDTEIRDIANQTDSLKISTQIFHQNTFIHPTLGERIFEEIDIQVRNETLKNRLLKRQTHPGAKLPIFEFKDKILSELENNRALLIVGDTGCGKTTQVPQFIMDSYTQNGNAVDCNILVSQPRRISAISLANRIAYERKEDLGDVAGYEVKLENVSLKHLGGILFCTTGMLLRKLQNNHNLEGCSHVILDEVHERSIDTDMLMILLKRAMQKNPDLKVLIMSATINAHLFQQYFNCPIIKIPGRLHHVEMNFLDDIDQLPNIEKYKFKYKYRNAENEAILVDHEKVVQIIKWISRHKPPGAILCFLPGWSDITAVQKLLEESPLESENQLILPMHSMISHAEQRKIFDNVPVDTRKIILSTDIAETGITVSDVCYVIDSAIRREMRWDSKKDLPYIDNEWISVANINQRKGRAGRVKPGVSYHLITKADYNKLEPYPVAQILRTSLEKVVLDVKTYTDEKVKSFMADMLQPPSQIAIQKAIHYLIDFGALDNNENLTVLGKRISFFSTHPKFSKALVYSSIFNCIHPIVTIASVFSNEGNLFYGTLDYKADIRENKKLYDPFSDHIALAWIYKEWFTHSLIHPHLIPNFCKKMRIRSGKMEILNRIRETFITQLIQCHMLSKNSTYNYDDPDLAINKYEDNDELVRAILYFATQQLIEHKNIGFKNGVLRTGVNELRAGPMKVIISGDSVNYKRVNWPSPYMTYFNSAHCNTRHSTIIRESSLISPLTVLLFSQGEPHSFEEKDDTIKIEFKVNQRYNVKLSCNKETADVLLRFKDIMWSVVQHSLENQGMQIVANYDTKKIFQYKDKLLETLAKTLHTASVCIESAKDESAKNVTIR